MFQKNQHAPVNPNGYNPATMRIHHSLSIVGILFGVLVTPPQARTQRSQQTDVHELERLEALWNEAHEHGDADTLESLWADDLEVAVPKMPVLTKADVIGFVRSGRMKFLTYRSSDIHIRAYENAAVVTGRLQRTRTINGQELSDDWRFTKTYIRQSGHWRVVSFHASEAEQP